MLTLSLVTSESRGYNMGEPRTGPIDLAPWRHDIIYVMESEDTHEPTETKNDLLRNLVRTGLIYFAGACMGLLVGLGGPAFLDLLLITNTDVEKGSVYFSAQYLGILISSAGAGLLYDRYHAEPILMASIMASGVINAVIPYCSLLVLMAVVNCAKGMAMGVVCVGIGVVVQRIWGRDRRSPYQQALHFALAVGRVVAPLLMRPFVAQRLTSVVHRPVVNQTAVFSGNDTSQGRVGNIREESAYGVTSVHSGFLIIGVITVFSGFTLMFLSITDRRTLADRYEITRTSYAMAHSFHGEDKHLARPVRAVFFAGIFMYFFFISASETIFSNFLMTFVVKNFHWDKPAAIRLMTVYGGAFAFGRFAGIPTAKYMAPGKIITVDSVALCATSLMFLFGVEKYREVVWISAVLYGVFVATLFAAGVTYVDQRMTPVTGKVYTVIIIASMTGAMVHPPILGTLMQTYSTVWFSYCAVIFCFVQFVIFVGLTVVTKKWGRVLE